MIAHIKLVDDSRAARQKLRDLGINDFLSERPDTSVPHEMAVALFQYLCSGSTSHWQAARDVVQPILHWLSERGQPVPQNGIHDLARLLNADSPDWEAIADWFSDHYG